MHSSTYSRHQTARCENLETLWIITEFISKIYLRSIPSFLWYRYHTGDTLWSVKKKKKKDEVDTRVRSARPECKLFLDNLQRTRCSECCEKFSSWFGVACLSLAPRVVPTTHTNDASHHCSNKIVGKQITVIAYKVCGPQFVSANISFLFIYVISIECKSNRDISLIQSEFRRNVRHVISALITKDNCFIGNRATNCKCDIYMRTIIVISPLGQ